MKTLILAVAIPFLAFIATSKLDEDNGFGNYKFGTSPAQYNDLMIELDEGRTKLYSSTEVSIPVKDVKAANIRVTFCRNQLSSICIKSKNGTGINFLQYLTEKYGTPQKVKGNYEWLSKKVQLLYEPIDNKDGAVTFYSREIYGK
ncbi:MAG: hypothetical protein ACXVC6_06960 [Bacteroidia bacterium]